MVWDFHDRGHIYSLSPAVPRTIRPNLLGLQPSLRTLPSYRPGLRIEAGFLGGAGSVSSHDLNKCNSIMQITLIYSVYPHLVANLLRLLVEVEVHQHHPVLQVVWQHLRAPPFQLLDLLQLLVEVADLTLNLLPFNFHLPPVPSTEAHPDLHPIQLPCFMDRFPKLIPNAPELGLELLLHFLQLLERWLLLLIAQFLLSRLEHLVQHSGNVLRTFAPVNSQWLLAIGLGY